MLAEAERLAARYQLVISPEPDVGYLGRTVEMPLVMADGRTAAKCAKHTLEATAIAIAAILERGEKPPAPASEGKRDQQVNLRLTPDEKFRLEQAARREGFRGLSDFVRSSALRAAE